MDEKLFSFTMYLIHEIADSRTSTPREVYRILKDFGCIDNYLIPHYEVLHTMGTDYLVKDICDYISSRGGSI